MGIGQGWGLANHESGWQRVDQSGLEGEDDFFFDNIFDFNETVMLSVDKQFVEKRIKIYS
jgi:streptomycin 6-kinase